MSDDTFIFLDEFLDTELYIFLNRCKEEILKFVWKEKDIEIIGKYQEKLESCYNTELQLEASFNLVEIGYDAVVYKILSKIEEEYFEWLYLYNWNDEYLTIEMSIYNYPDEIRNLDNEIIWTKENINKEHMDIINEKNKKLEVEKIDINKSNGQITNYNCLTGEPINIENHSSGENKWIAKKDVEKLEIEKKDNAKEDIGKIAVMMTEKEMEDYRKNKGMETKEITNPSNEKKLYIIPVPYYNISDLKITKEIEQKFVPMKEKEKSQEIEKSKGQGIGD